MKIIVLHVITTLESGGAQRIPETNIKNRSRDFEEVFCCVCQERSFDRKIRESGVRQIVYILDWKLECYSKNDRDYI